MAEPFSPEAAWGGLLSAAEPTGIISASWIAFECIRLCADEFADQATGHFATWVTAAATACEGRDALGRAPSMPTVAACFSPVSAGLAGAGEDAAARLAGELAAFLDRRLCAVVGQAATPEDAIACLRAAAAAAEIHALLAGAGGPP